ncbi:6960_t:CDS:2, partial [Racocetra persica]
VALNTPQNVQTGSTTGISWKFDGVRFDVPINISMGSYLAITWSYSGTQSRLNVLGIMILQISNILIIDSNVDFTKKSLLWAVTVDAGSYKFFLMDKISYLFVFSNKFIVSQKSEGSSSSYENMKIIDLEVDNYENKDRIGNDKKKRINNGIFKNGAMRIKNGAIPVKSIEKRVEANKLKDARVD